MTPSKLQEASDKAHVLDAETQAAIASVKHKGFSAVRWFVVCFVMLFLLGVGTYVRVIQSINKQREAIALQNAIAIESKRHIDCIIKDLSTPPPPGTPVNAKKYIENLQTDCNIKFTQ